MPSQTGPVAQLARASALHAEGHRFESGQVHNLRKSILRGSSKWRARYYPSGLQFLKLFKKIGNLFALISLFNKLIWVIKIRQVIFFIIKCILVFQNTEVGNFKANGGCLGARSRLRTCAKPRNRRWDVMQSLQTGDIRMGKPILLEIIGLFNAS